MFGSGDAIQFHSSTVFEPTHDTAVESCSNKLVSADHFELKSKCQPSDVQPCFTAKDPSIIEFCAGSARVTAWLQQLGMPASFGVDHIKQKNAGRVLIADLTTKSGRDLCWTWLKSPNCVGMFAAPPCGTCSKARGVPIKPPNGFLIAGPQPLRTDEHPNGVTKLSYINRIRVLQANSIYHFITAAAEFCLDHGKLVCIENPRSSLHWKTTFFQPLVNRLKFTAHQACAYRSSRPKWTALAHNTTTLLKLNHVCPGISALHKHKPWGVVNGPAGCKFSTAEETAYPLALAYRIAYSLAQELVLRGWNPPPVAFCPPDEVSYQYLRSVVGVQPKSSKIAPLVSEFRQILCIHVPLDCAVPVPPGDKLQSPWFDIPSGSCLLKKPPLRPNGGIASDTIPCNNGNQSHSLNNGNQSHSLAQVNPKNPSDGSSAKMSKELHFGVYRLCDQFISAAAWAGHPAGGETRLPLALQGVLEFLSSRSPKEVARHRSDTLNFWLNRGRDLCNEEKKLHESLHPSLKSILAAVEGNA